MASGEKKGEKKVAILTGASRGIGLAVARRMAEEGYRLILNSREPERALASVSAGAEIVPVAGDLGAPETAARLIEAAERFGRLDALLINHGGPPIKPLVDVTDEEWERFFRLMVLGPVRLLRGALPLIRRAGGGNVVAVGSYTVKEPQPGIVLSNALRAALVNALKTAALEHGPENVRINIVSPGFILTDRVREWNESYARQAGMTPEDIERRTVERIPLRRYGRPEEIAEVIVFLLTKNTYMSGQQLLVDGARTVAL
ncbi:MAG: SDR family oxidoreductase [Hydrogenibacillus schlegelii]|uniref:SDR family oxidoreductase n=1 Tax=Hydrogenibacillus schlegelii TaxID=1484 RepID=A0A947G9K5_HYDSH|nr:SDR family oxidoreductase [Hydrogenibacillus schlegelii]